MRTPETKGNALTVLFNKTCVLLLSLLYNNTEKTFYLREIARKIGMGAGTVQRELAKLVAADLVVRQVNGKQVYYGANTRSRVFNEVRGLVIKTFGLADIIEEALDPLSTRIDYAFIYGSQAEGAATADSDIDLMIVGRIGEMELHKAIGKAEKELDKAVNYSLFTLGEFRKRKKDKNGFIDRITAGKKIMLIGDENEI
ncbi:MAG: nucleotidyltransferase domain-containing protein [Pseudomonadota bacterium]